MSFLLREAGFQDIPHLRDLAGLFPLCSLPEEESQLEEKITISRDSFRKKLPAEKRNFLFVLEDMSLGEAVGSSQILSAYGREAHPFFVIEPEEGESGKILRLAPGGEGRHQLGGLILHPNYRASPERLGLQLGGVRLLYVGAFPEEFSPVLDVSLTAPFVQEERGRLRSFFYEEAGRPFVDESYAGAIRLLRREGGEFFSRFPRGIKIPMSKLSPRAREALGAAHSETAPACKGLLKMGFRKTPRRHCLDGGIYLEGQAAEIPLAGGARHVRLEKPEEGFWRESPPRAYLWGQNLKTGFAGGRAEGLLKGGALFLKDIPPCLSPGEPAFAAPL